MHGRQVSKREMNFLHFLIFACRRAPWLGWGVPTPGEVCWGGEEGRHGLEVVRGYCAGGCVCFSGFPSNPKKSIHF